MAQRMSNRSSAQPRPHLWLAAVEGTRQPAPSEAIYPADQPEAPLEVEFVGLTEAEQRKAIAGFPGGQRFVLVSSD